LTLYPDRFPDTDAAARQYLRAGRVRLTPRGWLLSNELFESLC